MHVFLSWSKPRSRALAKILLDWLPNVIQAVNPWMSTEIAKGTEWTSAIKGALAETGFCILCVTPENQTEPWLLFEGGAAANRFGGIAVAPLLLGFSSRTMTGPLGQFQSTLFDKSEVQELVRSINIRLGESRLPDGKLSKAFDVWWPELEKSVAAISAVEEAVPTEPNESALLREILETVRALYRHSMPSAFDIAASTERVIKTLTPREEKILRMRFGIGSTSDVGVSRKAERELLRRLFNEDQEANGASGNSDEVRSVQNKPESTKT